MPTIEEMFKKEIVYKIKNMNDVIVQKNLVYNHDNKNKLMMDMYTTYRKEHNTKLPVVILIHGEAKSIHNMKDAGQYCSLGRLIAASGLNAVTFNHRVLSDGFSIEEVFQDIDRLINYVINNAEDLGIDKTQIAIWCFSGGVPFGLYTGLSNYFDYVKCIIAYYGFGDFKYVSKFLPIDLDTDTIEKFSLLKLIQKNSALIPPLFIARAGLDNKILNESLDRFIAAALHYNLSVDILNHPTGQHSFDIFNDNYRTHEIISKSLDFLKTHLKVSK